MKPAEQTKTETKITTARNYIKREDQPKPTTTTTVDDLIKELGDGA